jgi:hypothetical protein
VTAHTRASGAFFVPRPTLLVAALAAATLLIVAQLVVAATNEWFGYAGIDYALYADVTRRWLSGGTFYQPWQLAGSYSAWDPYGSILYPPVALWLFVPFTVLPAVLWWAIPLAIVASVAWRLRPDPRVWPLVMLCIAWPPSFLKLVTGNPVMWIVAAVALGTIYAWPSVLVLIKPSLFPFALIGIRSRSWWFALAALVAASVPFGTMWISWAQTVINARDGGLLYSIQEVPLLALPLVVRLAARPRPTTSKPD